MADAASLNGDWIDWSGGECPVAPETLVQFHVRGAPNLTSSVRRADGLSWPHLPQFANLDIIAYRLAVQS